MERGPVYLSVVSYWEVSLKCSKGKLDVGDPRVWWSATLDRLAAIELPLRPEHIDEIHALPPIHKDPFDRAIAQAISEQHVLVSTDSAVSKYASSRLIVVS